MYLPFETKDKENITFVSFLIGQFVDCVTPDCFQTVKLGKNTKITLLISFFKIPKVKTIFGVINTFLS